MACIEDDWAASGSAPTYDTRCIVLFGGITYTSSSLIENGGFVFGGPGRAKRSLFGHDSTCGGFLLILMHFVFPGPADSCIKYVCTDCIYIATTVS